MPGELVERRRFGAVPGRRRLACVRSLADGDGEGNAAEEGDAELRGRCFRAAGAELVATDTPPRVTISEYLEVAKAFYPDGKEARFVNAVLDHMAREARPEAF